MLRRHGWWSVAPRGAARRRRGASLVERRAVHQDRADARAGGGLRTRAHRHALLPGGAAARPPQGALHHSARVRGVRGDLRDGDEAHHRGERHLPAVHRPRVRPAALAVPPRRAVPAHRRDLRRALAGRHVALLHRQARGGTTRRDAKSGAGDAMPSMTLGNVLAALGTAPFAGALAHLSGAGALVLLYLGVMQLGVSYWLFARGVRQVPAAEASLISMLEPVCNPLWVLLGTGERPGPWSIAGGAVVLGAVALRTLVKQ